jgi:hypothetical protein
MDAELVPGMSAQGVVGHELLCHLDREVASDPSGHVDPGQLCLFRSRRVRQFAPFLCEIRLLGIGLGAHRDILTRCHRECPRYEARDRGKQDGRPARLG